MQEHFCGAMPMVAGGGEASAQRMQASRWRSKAESAALSWCRRSAGPPGGPLLHDNLRLPVGVAPLTRPRGSCWLPH